jgi:hypothetical protein
MSTVDEKPGSQESKPNEPPAFSRVFSTTGKVVLALFVIALAVAAIVGLIALVRSSGSSSSDSTSEWEKNDRNESADKKRTSMPLSKWNRAIAAAIRQHCPAEGMSKEEAEQAVGKPTTPTTGSSWIYERTVQKECIKYDGDNCAEHYTAHEMAIFEFSPNGHLKSPHHDEGGWLHMNCFGEPFYSRYYKNW